MRETLSALPRYVLYALFGTWFTATLISQDPTRKFKGVHKWDRAGAVIPDWRFFAPRPGTHDYHLLFRDELPDGSVTDWKEVCGVEQRKISHLIWYPNRRAEKVLADAVSGMLQFAQRDDVRQEDIQVTMPYLTALNFINFQVEHHEKTRRIQFLICASSGYDDSEEPMMLFLSNLHPLDRAE